MKLQTSLLFSIIIFGAFFVIPAFSEEEIEDEKGGAGYGEGALLPELEIINLILFSFLLILIISLIKNKKLYQTNPSWIYFLFAIILYGLTRIFYIITDQGMLLISDDTLEVWWHLIFFNSLILLLLSLKNIMLKQKYLEKKSYKTPLVICIISCIFSVSLFFTAEPMDDAFVSAFSETFFSKIGIQHLIAFAFVSIIAFSLIEVRSFPERYTPQLFKPLVIIFLILATYHMWELLTESVEIIILQESVIEQVEQILVIPIFIFFIIGIIRVKKSMQEIKQ